MLCFLFLNWRWAPVFEQAERYEQLVEALRQFDAEHPGVLGSALRRKFEWSESAPATQQEKLPAEKQVMKKETMANSDDKPALKITLEDLASVELPAAVPAGNMAPTAAGAKQYGNIAAPADGPAMATEEKGHIFLQGWFYLGLAGSWERWWVGGSVNPFSLTHTPEMHWGNIRHSALCRSCLPALALAWLKALWSAQGKKPLLRGLLCAGAWVW